MNFWVIVALLEAKTRNSLAINLYGYKMNQIQLPS